MVVTFVDAIMMAWIKKRLIGNNRGKGKIVEFLWNLSQNGVKGNTLGSYSAVLRKLAKYTDLLQKASKNT